MGSASWRDRRRLLFFLALFQFSLNLRHPLGGLLMTLQCSEPVIAEGLLEILHAAETARFKRFTHAVRGFGISAGSFFGVRSKLLGRFGIQLLWCLCLHNVATADD